MFFIPVGNCQHRQYHQFLKMKKELCPPKRLIRRYAAAAIKVALFGFKHRLCKWVWLFVGADDSVQDG